MATYTNSKKLTISFCTLCMNRLHHVQKTLPQNINDTLDYPEANFILLDYNSTDGLETWVTQNLGCHLTSGKLIYYKYNKATHFHRSHSRNLVFKAATGEIICNVDADNFIGYGFADYINSQFLNNENIFLTTIDLFKKHADYYVTGDVLGRICLKKSDFMTIKGYDERMASYGFEDYDITNRLEIFGLSRTLIYGDEFLKFISHDAEERYSLNNFKKSFKSFYINYNNPWQSDVLILFHDQTFGWATIVNNLTKGAGKISNSYKENTFLFNNQLKGNKWHKGTWQQENSLVTNLYFNNGKKYKMDVTPTYMVKNDTKCRYYAINEEHLLNKLITIYIMSGNRTIMEHNLHKRAVIVNKTNFGAGELTNPFITVN